MYTINENIPFLKKMILYILLLNNKVNSLILSLSLSLSVCLKLEEDFLIAFEHHKNAFSFHTAEKEI